MSPPNPLTLAIIAPFCAAACAVGWWWGDLTRWLGQLFRRRKP